MSQFLMSGRITRRFPAGYLLAAGFLCLVLLAVVFPGLLTHHDPLNADPVNAQLPLLPGTGWAPISLAATCWRALFMAAAIPC